jgi:hypothetical protein
MSMPVHHRAILKRLYAALSGSRRLIGWIKRLNPAPADDAEPYRLPQKRRTKANDAERRRPTEHQSSPPWSLEFGASLMLA